MINSWRDTLIISVTYVHRKAKNFIYEKKACVNLVAADDNDGMYIS